jgi:ABC-2 type transport system ATP-binding protein
MTAVFFDRACKEVASGFWGHRRRVLDDVSFSCGEGRIHGLVGHNGAGKSTCLRLLTGCSRPTQGVVRIFDVDPTVPKVRRRLGFAPDIAALPPTLVAAEVIAFVAAMRGEKKVDPRSVVERVGLDLRREPIGSYSKGMQQRLSLAVAILGNPELWVLDEPMSGLDPQGRELVRHLMTDHRLRGGTIFFSSHSLADVDALCETLTVVERGKVVFAGATSEFIGDAHFELEFVGPVAVEGARQGIHGSVVDVSGAGLKALIAQVGEARIHSIHPRVPELGARLAARR